MPAKTIRFKVKPRKNPMVVPCATEMSALLACFASSGDLRSTTECVTASKNLHICMSKRPLRFQPPKKSTINYLLTKTKK